MTTKIDFRPLVIQRFIDAVLHFNKRIAVSEIQDVFGVSRTTASQAIKAYRNQRPDTALYYSGYEKLWKATADWRLTDEFWPANEHPVQFLKALKTVYGVTISLTKGRRRQCTK